MEIAQMINEIVDMKLSRMECKLDMYTDQISALSMTTKILGQKFATQLNMWDRKKIGYNFAFMFASPPAVTENHSSGKVIT